MQLRARHRGIDDLHDDFFRRIVGRTVSRAENKHDEPSGLHYHVLTFSKPDEPDAQQPVVPVGALVRPKFSLSRQTVGSLQHLLMERSDQFVELIGAERFAQLHYCMGTVWAVAWLPLEAGRRVFPSLQEYEGLIAGAGAAGGHRRLIDVPDSALPGGASDPSGSPSDVAALSGRAQRAVPPEASPEGRTTFLSEQLARVRSIVALNVENEQQRLEAIAALDCLEGSWPE